VDWDLGHYEHIARQLHPAAELLVDCLAPRTGERLVDIGCGTGNAALLAARAGARVVGVDPSPRLVAVGRREARDGALEVAFVVGTAEAIPCADASVDAVVSAFGVIFASDATRAVAEMARILAPHGRIALSAWVPEGPVALQAGIRRRAVAAASGEPPLGAPFAWHDPETLGRLFGPHGFAVEVRPAAVAFTAPSVSDYAEGEWHHHPLWVEARAVLEPLGRWQAVRDEARRVLEDGNEVPGAFRVTSPYVVAVARRGHPGPTGR